MIPMLPNTVAPRPGRASRASLWLLGVGVAAIGLEIVNFSPWAEQLSGHAESGDGHDVPLGILGTFAAGFLGELCLPAAFILAVVGYARQPRRPLARVALVATVAIPFAAVLYFRFGP